MKIKKGFYILEALLAVVILSMVLLSLYSMVSFLQRRTVKSSHETEASLLLQEGMEIAHSALLASWKSYPDGVYSPANAQLVAIKSRAGIESGAAAGGRLCPV